MDMVSETEMIYKSPSLPSLNSEDTCIHLSAVYDYAENLVQLKMENNTTKIPRIVMKIIGLTIPFQPYLKTILINKGLDQYSLYEVVKFLPTSNITDLCLDGANIKDANYSLILETPNYIRYLSLARCSITDDVAKTMTELLVYPQPASKTLSILNLSTNRITDLGASYFAECLRSNRQMSYLNLASNMLTDAGAAVILNTLVKFPLTFNELLSSRSRHIKYLKEKNDLVLQIAKDLRVGEMDKRAMKRKSVKPAPVTPKKKGLEKEPSLKSLPEAKSLTNMDVVFLEKAAVMAENSLGGFNDPFTQNNTFVQDGIVYCYGNNSLYYINMSYNNLSYVSLKRLLEVLMYQKRMCRIPRGLVNVSVEGNNFPVECSELAMIDRILDTNMSLHQRRMSVAGKRKPPGKGK